MSTAVALELVCDLCRAVPKKRDKPYTRLPPRWKRVRGNVCCPKCVADRYATLAVTAAMQLPGSDERKAVLDELWAAWRESARYHNWLVRKMALREPDDISRGEMPSMPDSYLYPEARSMFPGLPPSTIVAADHAVRGKYRSARKDMHLRMCISLPSYKSPQPLVLRAKAFTISRNSDDRFCVSFSTVSGEPRRIFPLYVEPRDVVTKKRLEQLVMGEAEPVEMKVMARIRKGGAFVVGSFRRGNQRVGYDVAVKIAGRFPRRQKQANAAGTLFARTDSESLLIALDADARKLRVWNADHVRRWVAEHRRNLDRWGDDQKAEQRPVPRFASRRARAVEKHANRMRTAIEQLAAELVGVAVRRRFARLEYDDSDRRFADRFPWHQLKNQIERVCGRENIEFAHASSAACDASE